MEKEKGSRLTLESPVLGSKSLYSSRHSLPGFRSPGLPELLVEKEDSLLEELAEERERCDKLKECLEIERARYTQLEAASQLEVAELMDQLAAAEQTIVHTNRQLEGLDQLNKELSTDFNRAKDTIDKLTQEIEQLEIKLQRKRTESKENLLYDAFYVEDLEAKIEAHRGREQELETQVAKLSKKISKDRSSRSSPGYQLTKSSSLKQIPSDPQEQASYFYRLLLRAESYRKALIWQKRYLS